MGLSTHFIGRTSPSTSFMFRFHRPTAVVPLLRRWNLGGRGTFSLLQSTLRMTTLHFSVSAVKFHDRDCANVREVSMSSTMGHKRRLEHWIMIAASMAFTLWYAKGQLLYTLHFGYELVRVWFPQWLPSVGSSSG